MVNADYAVENDPLADYSFFPFNSSLFRSITNPNLGSPLSRLKNLMLRNPDTLLKQAKTVIDSSMDHVESDKTMGTVSEDNSNASGVVNDINPQERRAALGLKRAKISEKPMPSQTKASLEPTLGIDELKDPEEFFAAFERTENLKEELRRLKGQPVEDIDKNRASLHHRHPKPSLARKSAIYKHRSHSLTRVPDNDETLTSYEEAYDHSIISPTRENTIPETNAMNFSPQTKVSDVDPAMSSTISELDELLSYDYEGLDEDGVQSLLQDKLNIKLVNIGEPSFLNMPNARRHEYASFIEALPDMENSCKAACSKPLNISNQYRKSSNIQVSPPLSKSPLASISTLHKHIARLTPLKDPFSPEVIDSSPEVCYSTQAQNKKQADLIGTRFSANKEETNECGTSPCIRENLFDIRFPTNGEHNLAVLGEASLAGIKKDVDMSACREDEQIAASPKSFGKDAFNKGSGVEVNVNEGDGEMGEALNTQNILMISPSKKTVGLFKCKPRETEKSTPVSQENINVETVNKARKGKARSIATVLKNKHAETEKSTTLENINVETVNKGRQRKARSNATVLKDKCEETDKPTSLSQENIHMETVTKARKRKAKSNASVSMDKRKKETKKSTSLSEENINVETVNRARKMKARSNATGLKESKNKKRKVEGAFALPTKVDEQLVTHSLKEAGTKWEVGVRRSTRIRMRPLEFWKGERFLYGRVHESLVSVIGVKYASPAKNTEERVVKVKSFVPNEYKDMVDLASSY